MDEIRKEIMALLATLSDEEFAKLKLDISIPLGDLSVSEKNADE